MKKYIFLLIFLIAGIFIGNRIFNHIHAWLGVLTITSTVIYFIYKLIKILGNLNSATL